MLTECYADDCKGFATPQILHGLNRLSVTGESSALVSYVFTANESIPRAVTLH
jgi:hypothetical protein